MCKIEVILHLDENITGKKVVKKDTFLGTHIDTNKWFYRRIVLGRIGFEVPKKKSCMTT